MKLQKPNQDPLEHVHWHLHELILQHFDQADVIILSEVNKHWFDTIGESSKCMKQINLGLENWWQTETPEDMSRVMKIVKKTTRKYQNVHFNCNDDESVSKSAVNLLLQLAPSLVDVRFLNADNVVKPKENISFPKLERLQFINNVAEVDEILLLGCTQLKELNLKHHYWAQLEQMKSVFDCLKSNKHLKILKLWDTGICKLFKEYEPSMFPFSLKRFATGADGTIDEQTEENFLQFLDSQNESLEAIRFRSGLDGISSKFINKVFKMSAMRIIHLDGVRDDVKELNLVANPKIIELRLPWNFDTVEKVSPFLRATPNAEVLFIRKVNKEVLEYVASHMKELKILHFTVAEGCMGCFKRFLSTHEDANNSIRLVFKEWY